MPLKFPTTTSPFPQVALTEGDCLIYEERAATLLRNTLAEYDTYNVVKKRQLDKKQWKPVKTRENLTVHCARRDQSTGVTGGSSSTPRAPQSATSAFAAGVTKIGEWFSNAEKERCDWSLPPLLAVGSIAGTLDDVMYGIATFDSSAMFLKSAYTDNELVDGEVLYSIKTPTPEAPFQFVGLKWIVKAQPIGINAIVWPRDVVYLESTGVIKRPDGERIGYQLMHSVNLPECADLRDQGVLRATLSSCFLFKQLPKGAVDVYMKAHVEPNGKVSHAIAIKSTAASLIYCWKSVACAQRKKLAWRLQVKQQQQQSAQASELPSPPLLLRRGSQLSSCALCSKSVGKLRHAVKCELCDEPVCSKCHVLKKLRSKGSWAKEVTQRVVAACTRCIASTNQMDAFGIASEQVKAVCWEDIGNDVLSRSMHKHSAGELDRHSSERTTAAWQSDRSTGTLGSSPETAAALEMDWVPRFSHSFDITAPISEPRAVFDVDELDDVGFVEPSSSSSLSSSRSTSSQRYPQAYTSGLTHQQQLLLQMAELRTQAESVYQYTKKNGESHLNSNRSARSLQLLD